MAGKPANSSHTDMTRMAPKPAKAHLTLDGSLLQTRDQGCGRHSVEKERKEQQVTTEALQ